MKKKNLLYSLATLALIALIAGVISYATEMRPTQRETQQVPVASSTTPETSTETETAVAVRIRITLITGISGREKHCLSYQ